MKKALKTLILLIAITSFLFPKSAVAKTQSDEVDGIKITRIAPESANLGEKIWINLVFENTSSATKTFTLKENLNNADFDKTEAKYVETEYKERFWYYEWKIKLPAGENTVVSYYHIPKNLGTYTISPSLISVDNNNFYLKSYSIKVKCLPDNECNIDSGENYLTCPEDCKTGSYDMICDFAKDGRCDPDCEKTADPDCSKTLQHLNNQLIIFTLILLIILLLVVISIKIIKKKIGYRRRKSRNQIIKH